MDKIIPILFIAGAVLSALGIWLPRFRGHWKGTRVQCGPVTCASSAFLCATMGIGALCFDTIPQRERIWFALLFILGWIAVVIGYALDKRAQPEGSLGSQSSPVHRAPSRGIGRERVFLALGFWFLITIIWSIIHR
jgi:hypothetical protein